MKIYHYTKYKFKDIILKEGLIFNRQKTKEDYGTRVINSILNKYKPDYLPGYINRDKCVFFFFQGDRRDFGFEVDTENLNQSRLYVFDFDAAQQLYDMLIKHSTLDECKGEEFQRLAMKYWASMIPFSQCSKDAIDLESKEVLYFDTVPAHLLRTINEESKEFNNILNKVIKHYEITRPGLNDFTMYQDHDIKFDCTYDPDDRLLKVHFYNISNEKVFNVLKEIAASESISIEGILMTFTGFYELDNDGVTIKRKLEV